MHCYNVYLLSNFLYIILLSGKHRKSSGNKVLEGNQIMLKEKGKCQQIIVYYVTSAISEPLCSRPLKAQASYDIL